MIHIQPLIIPILGPLAIHGYGIAIAVALIVFILLAYNRIRKFVPMSFDTATSILVRCIIAGLIGGRILHLISAWDQYKTLADACAVWSGGLSILGCMIAVSIYLPYTLWKNSIPLGIALDSAALYAPIAHAIGRLGCLWAGCCFGCVTDIPWAVTYHGITSGAPVDVMLHPTQLYSALCFLALFLVMRYIIAKRAKVPGALASSYLIGMSMERFFMDFVRNDRVFLTESILSMHQWIALALIFGTLAFVCTRYYILRARHTTMPSTEAKPAFKAQNDGLRTPNPAKEKSATYSKSNTSV
jgi:phosphatidylglycerol:prolipoprotein diacylglycerol transferase